MLSYRYMFLSSSDVYSYNEIIELYKDSVVLVLLFGLFAYALFFTLLYNK